MFVDAQEMQRKHPNTFEAPSEKELNKLVINSSVKICNNQERFWVTITEIDNQKLKGKIDNDLIDSSEFDYGDEIEFEKRHIYNIFQEG